MDWISSRNRDSILSNRNPAAVDSVGLKREIGENGDEDDGLRSLLSPLRVEKPKSVGRKVQWNDMNGDKLVEILEFQPSEASDSEDEDDSDFCTCIIM